MKKGTLPPREFDTRQGKRRGQPAEASLTAATDTPVQELAAPCQPPQALTE